MMDEKIKQLLQDARSHIYSWSTNDLTYQLAKEVMSIGLAKIKSFYQQVDSDPNNVLAIFGPDGSITRNKSRFKEGVGYGCAVVTKEYLFPSLLHPNGCGFGLYHINDVPTLSQIMDRLGRMKQDGVPVGGKKGEWDVWKSNHFIDILRLESIESDYLDYEKLLPAGHYVLIHSSQQTEKQKLSYWKREDFVQTETPFGTVEGLTGKACTDYLKYFELVEEYSKNKRTSIAENLFGEENISCISNPTHQGYYKEGDSYVMRLGLYNSLDKTGDKNLPFFPLGFNGYSFIYLYEGCSNIKEPYWTNLQVEKAEKYNHRSIIENINILPHGGGYKLFFPFSHVKTHVHNMEYYFELSHALMESRMFIQNVESLEYGYRGPTEVLPFVEKFDLGQRVARFVPIQVIKY